MNGNLLSPVERAQALESVVREHADSADAERRLAPEVAQAMAGAGLYRIGAPRAFGGEEADPRTQIETIEAMGLNVKVGEHVMDRFGYLAGRDEDRAADFLRL